MAELSEADVCLETAKMAEVAERHADMAQNMKKLVVLSGTKAIDKNSRNLLSVAYKNLVGSKRSSWRVVASMIDKMQQQQHEEDKTKASEEELLRAKAKLELSRKYQATIVAELKAVCDEVVELLDDYLIKNADEKDYEQKTFFYKMKGDYYRYLAEVLKDNDSKGFDDACSKSAEAYEEASKASADENEPLAATNPVLLGNKLNYSVFQYEIKNDPKKACELAKQAFDNAIGELDGLQEDSYKDSTLIMQLLRDNLTLWTAETTEDTETTEDAEKDE